jgi:hypothetical protein
MADTSAGGPGGNRMYVRYRRKDGSEATAPFETTGDGLRYSWTAPEDCVAVIGFEEIGGGGGRDALRCGGGGDYTFVPVTPGKTFTYPEADDEPVPAARRASSGPGWPRESPPEGAHGHHHDGVREWVMDADDRWWIEAGGLWYPSFPETMTGEEA